MDRADKANGDFCSIHGSINISHKKWQKSDDQNCNK